ncbi:MAG: DNA primase [Dehalococcoidia bacterium]|nr:DNA primase [Dehalococcoidia bacterium]
MGIVDEIKQKIDIVEVIGQYTKLTKAGRMFRAPCPFHSEKRPSFFVYPEQQTWHCFGACSTGGDVFSFIMKKEGVNFGEALRLLADRAGVTITAGAEPDAGAKEKDRLYQINLAAAQYFNNLLINSSTGEKARAYVHGRGLKPEAISSFQLGYSLNSWESLKQYLVGKGYTEEDLLTAGLIIKSETGKTHDRFRDHLMFPIFDDRGRVTGFGARVLDDSLPKYVNSPQTPLFDKSGSLYGINLAKSAIRQQDLAVLVEGYMDVIMAHQSGFANVVAPMGTSITDRQISQIKKLTKNIALALDADAAGEEAMLRCVSYENALGAEVKVITLPEGKDPDEVIKQGGGAWEHLVAGAVPVVDFTISVAASRLDLSTARDKASLMNKLMPIIAEVKDVARQNHYLNRLAALTGVNQTRLEAAMVRAKPDQKAKETRVEASARALRSVRSNPVEEYFLALVLQHPELKARGSELPVEYFESSENGEIFTRWREAGDLEALKSSLDPAIREHLDNLLSRTLPDTRLEAKYADCALRLREKFLRNLETKKERILALEESGGSEVDLADLEKQQKIEVRHELQKVFNQKAKISKEGGE